VVVIIILSFGIKEFHREGAPTSEMDSFTFARQAEARKEKN
jgi:hypothetical protein